MVVLYLQWFYVKKLFVGCFKLAINCSPDNYSHLEYGISIDARGTFLLLNDGFVKNVTKSVLIWTHMCMLITNRKIS